MRHLSAILLSLALSSAAVAQQPTGRVAEIPAISGEINPGGGNATTESPADAPQSVRAIRCGDGFCSWGESAASCPSDCPGAYGNCGSAQNTLVTSFPTGTAACDPGQATTQNGDGVGNDGTYNWYCLGTSGSSPECFAQRPVYPACGSANNGGSLTYPTGSPACAIGTQYDRDTAGVDGFYNWDCVGINTPATESCQATNLSAPPVCKAYGGAYVAEPSSNDATGCDRGTFGNAADSVDTWRWTCSNSNTGASANCSAAKPTPAPTAAPTPVPTATPVPSAPRIDSFASSAVADPVNPGWYVATTGQTITLSWTSTNATTCTASGQWSGSKAVDGSQGGVTPASAPPGNRTYTLTCTNGAQNATASIVVRYVNAPTVNLTASPTAIATGGTSTLTWSTNSSATSCTASGNWSGAKSTGTSQTQTVSPASSGTKTYTLTCFNDAGASGSDSVSITVGAAPTPAPGSTGACGGVGDTVTWGSANQCSGTVPNDADGFWPISVTDSISSGNGYTGTMRFACSGDTSSYTLSQSPTAGDGCTGPAPTPTPTPTAAPGCTGPVTVLWSGAASGCSGSRA
ncbi:MAG: hypothetical protein WC809_07255, partial [Sinimarinibacterium sp.]